MSAGEWRCAVVRLVRDPTRPGFSAYVQCAAVFPVPTPPPHDHVFNVREDA